MIDYLSIKSFQFKIFVLHFTPFLSCVWLESHIFFSEYHPYLPAGDTTMTPLATIPSASMENFVKGKKCYHIIDKARQIVGK